MYQRFRTYIDGTPCALKGACTVWIGGKSGDNFKGLPIDIISGSGDPGPFGTADADDEKPDLHGGYEQKRYSGLKDRILEIT